MPVVGRTPYRNLILTGTIGVGKTGVGRAVESRMEGAQFIDLETEIERREGHSSEKIRELFGAAKVRSVETQLVQEVTLRRSMIIAVSGNTVLDPANLARLRETGPMLCLTAALGEILRRQHVRQGGRFHDANNRAVLLGRVKRERRVLELGLETMDTTGMEVTEVAERAIRFWQASSDT